MRWIGGGGACLGVDETEGAIGRAGGGLVSGGRICSNWALTKCKEGSTAALFTTWNIFYRIKTTRIDHFMNNVKPKTWLLDFFVNVDFTDMFTSGEEEQKKYGVNLTFVSFSMVSAWNSWAALTSACIFACITVRSCSSSFSCFLSASACAYMFASVTTFLNTV